jgi:hypothetical protein
VPTRVYLRLNPFYNGRRYKVSSIIIYTRGLHVCACVLVLGFIFKEFTKNILEKEGDRLVSIYQRYAAVKIRLLGIPF